MPSDVCVTLDTPEGSGFTYVFGEAVRKSFSWLKWEINNLFQSWNLIESDFFFNLENTLQKLFIGVQDDTCKHLCFPVQLWSARAWRILWMFTQGVKAQFTLLMLFALETIHVRYQSLKIHLKQFFAREGHTGALRCSTGHIVCCTDKDDKCHNTACLNTLFF